jgi:hypothetical protein
MEHKEELKEETEEDMLAEDVDPRDTFDFRVEKQLK